ncbi:cell division protein FtsI (penicillin-binding protein 3) [Thalassovita litoralis]|jgi:cell division protein FtsI (penicillin-binding protein 3)|uniref:Cell division protein FtsI (Penicillin-binding protein 3) n=1 Tax=Thalassovita litoralis TaxID=1010611 RepID=A0A521B4K9_9RHOB|nr:penicillin-binding protein 2 [Thalassovita litoralis]SMO41996.1 cell division protein FtsI (penicillin-binding protein 3) [Thalassovita litoralis]
MIRTPLRPLARILEARNKGENPDAIERENIRLRHEAMRDRARQRAESRLLLLAAVFCVAYAVIGFRMGVLASTDPAEPQVYAAGASIRAQRADIVDRQNRILATNIETYSLYAKPPIMIDPARAARELAAMFPELNEDRLLRDFTGKRKFIWLRRKLSPEQKQAVHDIGEPGLLFGPREMRLYPNGRLAAHVLGGASFGVEDVSAAEVIGVAGIERMFDERLRDPARADKPLMLSLDLAVQDATEQVLEGGMRLMNAKGAAAVLMDVHTGEVISLVSLPDFDPNDRPRPAVQGHASDSPLFNRAVQGVYELGSTFKIFATAQAIELGLVNAETEIDTRGPLRWGKFRIRDFHNYGNKLTVTKVIVKSSNIGTARIAQMIGTVRQQEFMKKLGFFDPTPLEITEAGGGKPLLPPNWSELSTMTISYGHGLSATPLHLATAYAMIANGGYRIKPTVLRQPVPPKGERVMSAKAAEASRIMLRKVVTEGTASFGEVAGYEVAGKTGTADKPKENGGGYYDDKVIATFASMFPASDPKYVLVVTLDEPVETTGPEPRRTAGWTAVPVAAEMIRRVAPLLGLRPAIEPGGAAGITLTSN